LLAAGLVVAFMEAVAAGLVVIYLSLILTYRPGH